MRDVRLNSGFTLLEVLVAMSILSIGIVVILASIQSSYRGVGTSEGVFRASLLGEEMLTRMTHDPIVPGHSTGISQDGRFSWDVTVTPWSDPSFASQGPDGESHNLFLARIEVRWPERRKERSVVCRELIYWVGEGTA